ncbi:MAG TPA: colicin immunity domain-containing protein [Albitalea sp.]
MFHLIRRWYFLLRFRIRYARAPRGTWSDAVADYRTVMEAFLRGEMAADDFCDEYFRRFKADKRVFGDRLFEVLNEVFVAADSFTRDPELLKLKDGFHIDEAEFRTIVSRAAQQLDDSQQSAAAG